MMLKNLSSRERNLALALGSIAFLLLNLVLLPQLLAYNKAAHQKASELQAQVAAARTWVSKRDYWNERKEWLEQNEPALNAAREDSAAQFEALQKAAREHGLKITDVQLLQLDPTEFYQPVGARLVVAGPWPGLVKFVSSLQNPDQFDVIPRFSVKSDDPPPNVQCEFEIQRWFYFPEEATP